VSLDLRVVTIRMYENVITKFPRKNLWNRLEDIKNVSRF
jgi:hypothetical protein